MKRTIKQKDGVDLYRPIKKSSAKIIDLLLKGKRPFEVQAMGYSKYTVLYYHRKINHPEKFARMIANIRRSQLGLTVKKPVKAETVKKPIKKAK
jgi:hypothetical protein